MDEVEELRKQLADARAQLARWKSEALRHCENYESQFYARRAAEARAEQAEAILTHYYELVPEFCPAKSPESPAHRPVLCCLPDEHDGAHIFGDPPLVRAALAAAGPSAPETPSEERTAFVEQLAGLPEGRRAEIFPASSGEPEKT